MSAPETCLSMSEIEALALRAARGAGRGWGEAEEAAWATVWLARAGAPWAVALLTGLPAPHGPAPVPGRDGWGGQAPFCGLRAGIVLADFAALPEGPGAQEITLKAVRAPLLLLPFAARAAERLGGALSVCWPGGSLWLVPRGAPQLAGGWPGADAVPTMIIAAVEATVAAPVSPPTHPSHAVSEGQFAALKALALKMTVPTSAQSQAAGAGASGSDND